MSSLAAPTIVWFRQDLRLADNPALAAAAQNGQPVIPVFIWSPDEEAPWQPGAASRWWLHHSLCALATSLARCGSRLIVRSGRALPALRSLARECGAKRVLWNRRYEPAVVARDTEIKEALSRDGLQVASFCANLLFEPWQVQTRAGTPFKTFTPFWNACRQGPDPPPPIAAPLRLIAPENWPDSRTAGSATTSEAAITALALLPRVNWADEFTPLWTPGEAGAQRRLRTFLEGALERYDHARNLPASGNESDGTDGSSRLSPHLHFGELSPRQLWYEILSRDHKQASPGAGVFLKELGWREFGHHLLFHFPRSPLEPLRETFADFPWAEAPQQRLAWQRGQTGYPLVDAGMRQLWRTGFMHNRVRMVVASFLVKHLLLPWQEGARWFWDTLVDADLANNTLGWQWSAGCGADAAPFFRIFNPTLQGERFDPAGAYVRRWLPRLARLPARWIHQPWRAPADELARAQVVLGETYPFPVVDHGQARQRALAAFADLKDSRREPTEP